MATKDKIGKVTTPVSLNRVSVELAKENRSNTLQTVWLANGGQDIAIGISESVWWFEQLTEFRHWPQIREELETPLDDKYFAFEGWFGPWDTLYANSYVVQGLFEAKLAKLKSRQGLLMNKGPYNDPDTNDRRHLFQRVLELIVRLPEAEDTFLKFVAAVLSHQVFKRRKWLEDADARLEGAESAPSLAMLSHNSVSFVGGYIGTFEELRDYLWNIHGLIETTFKQPGRSEQDQKRWVLLTNLFKANMDEFERLLDAGREAYAAVDLEMAAKRQEVLEARDRLSEERRHNFIAMREKAIGYQARSFRMQRKMTLGQVAHEILMATDEAYDDEDVLEDKEKKLGLMTNNVARIERGDRGRRGIPANIETALCTALKCTQRELKQAPLGYHLSVTKDQRSNLIQVHFEGDKATFKRTTATISPDNMPEMYRRPNQQVNDTVCYLPPLYDEGDAHELDRHERIGLLRCAIQYHWDNSSKIIRDVSDYPASITHNHQTEMTMQAENFADDWDWSDIEKAGSTLHAFVSCSDEGENTWLTTGGFTWNNEWYSIEAGQQNKKQPEEQPIKDEVHETAQPSAFPSPQPTAFIPISGYAAASNDDEFMQFIDNGQQNDRPTETPPFLMGVNGAFAVEVHNNSMEPRYFPRDLLYCDPYKPARGGEYVVAQLTGERAVVKKYEGTATKKNGEKVFLFGQLNPAKELQIPKDEVIKLFLIVGTRTT